MTVRRMGNEAGARSTSFERFAGVCAILAGVSDLLYAIAFLVLQRGIEPGTAEALLCLNAVPERREA